MSECRTIVDGAHSGVWNMAVDETLVERAAADKQPRLRLYGWKPATLSLGYFQRVADRRTHQRSIACPFVRRPSGGGAILHDREITYCLAMPGERVDGAALYRRVHTAFADALGKLGIQAELAETASGGDAAMKFLCFQRRAVGDVLVGGHKVIGSAQRRRRGALLQHGGILLRASPAAQELPGIADLAALDFEHGEWLAQFKEGLARALDCRLTEAPLTEAETEHAGQLARRKYSASAWNEMR